MKANLQWHTQRANGLFNLLNSYAGWTFNIYSGTIPAASTIASEFVPSNYTATRLLTFAPMAATGFARTTDNYQRIFLSSIPAAVAASQTGVATWFALFNSTGVTASMIGDVSDVSGTAPLKLITPSLVSGTSYDIYSFAFTFKQ